MIESSSIALVTGGSGELGSAISRALAADGHQVAVHCNSQRDKADAVVNGIAASGGQARAYAADLHSSEAADTLIEQVVAEAIRRAVRTATGIPGVPAVGEAT